MQPSSFDLTWASVARLLGYLPCGACGREGKRRTFIVEAGGYVAACDEVCEAEIRKHAGQDRVDALHDGQTLVTDRLSA